MKYKYKNIYTNIRFITWWYNIIKIIIRKRIIFNKWFKFNSVNKYCVLLFSISILFWLINSRTKLSFGIKFCCLIDIDNLICDCKLSYDKITNNYYLYVPNYVDCIQGIKNRSNICAIDPGEKVPFTYYSTNDYGFIGDDIRKDILKYEAKIRKYQRLLNHREKKDKTKKVNKSTKNLKQVKEDKEVKSKITVQTEEPKAKPKAKK